MWIPALCLEHTRNKSQQCSGDVGLIQIDNIHIDIMTTITTTSHTITSITTIITITITITVTVTVTVTSSSRC